MIDFTKADLEAVQMLHRAVQNIEGVTRAEILDGNNLRIDLSDGSAMFVNVTRYNLPEQLAAARELARELAEEYGEVTQAELDKLREKWPVRSIAPVVPETWKEE